MIEYQSDGREDTLIHNAKNAGYSEVDIEVVPMSGVELESILKAEANTPEAIEARKEAILNQPSVKAIMAFLEKRIPRKLEERSFRDQIKVELGS